MKAQPSKDKDQQTAKKMAPREPEAKVSEQTLTAKPQASQRHRHGVRFDVV